jgi:hypothetical protein
MINKPATYAALVKSLEYSVTDYEHNAYDPEWDNWHLRDVVEQGCLLVLAQLTEKFGPDGLIRSRFVELWLAKEPWGKTDEERRTNFMESLGRNNRLTGIAGPIFQHKAGRRQLIKANLVGTEYEAEPPLARDVKMTNGESTAGEDFEGMFVDGSRRRRDQSSEEEHIRRRHREAMVLNDGTRPLGRDDIIQRRSV